MSATGTVLITGANRGLGLGLTRAFVRCGWRVFAGCRRPDDAEELARLEAAGVERITLDVRDGQSVTAALEHVSRVTVGLDVVVNNAGINPEPRDATVAEVSLSALTDALEVNVLGALRVLQASVPLLRRGHAPRIVNVSSGAGSLAHNSAQKSLPAYCISKAALNMLTRRAARDLPEITVVSVSPGWIRTDMGGPDAALGVDEASEALVTSILGLGLHHTGQWLDRFGQPSEYAW